MAKYDEVKSESKEKCMLCGKEIKAGEVHFKTDLENCELVCDRCQYLLSKKYNYRAGLKTFFEYLLSTDILRCEPCGSNSVEITEWGDDEVEVFCTICNYIYRVDITKKNIKKTLEENPHY